MFWVVRPPANPLCFLPLDQACRRDSRGTLGWPPPSRAGWPAPQPSASCREHSIQSSLKVAVLQSLLFPLAGACCGCMWAASPASLASCRRRRMMSPSSGTRAPAAACGCCTSAASSSRAAAVRRLHWPLIGAGGAAATCCRRRPAAAAGRRGGGQHRRRAPGSQSPLMATSACRRADCRFGRREHAQFKGTEARGSCEQGPRLAAASEQACTRGYEPAEATGSLAAPPSAPLPPLSVLPATCRRCGELCSSPSLLFPCAHSQ